MLLYIHMSSHPKLLGDVAQAKRIGMNDGQIRHVLEERGWRGEDIDQALIDIDRYGNDYSDLPVHRERAIGFIMFLVVAALIGCFAWAYRAGYIPQEYIPKEIQQLLPK